ncbi:hypothetical protein [Streptomyces acidicola]|uniref:hypothetical protein n=1 Tax=Streptomyces acidicola TaxID=2596892 RepID=UPI0018837249|nr:hypothetical protein [Streptomyces acidicola]
MAKPRTAPATAPDTVWLSSGRHVGSGAEESVRQRLTGLKDEGEIDDRLEYDARRDDVERRAFEARWRVAGDVVVRARLTIGPPSGMVDSREWTLVAEADRPWNLDWPSPTTMFWPEDASWDHDMVPGLRLRESNPLPAEDKELKRLLKDCGRHTESIHIVVHEAMTPDQLGRRPLAPLMPASLRHRIVEHRATPDQYRIVNWALYDLGVRVPRGGAVVLPGTPARPGYEDHDFTVRSVFLDGSQPKDLIETVVRYASLPRPLAPWAEQAVAELRDEWHLYTVDEARALVAQYSEALQAMTKSRDLYREAAERAHEALAAFREGSAAPAVPSARGEEPRKPARFSLRALTKPLERVGGGAKLQRPANTDAAAQDTAAHDTAASGTEDEAPSGSGRESGSGSPERDST